MTKAGFFSRITAPLLDQRDRWVLWLPVPLAAGVGLYFSLLSEPPSWMGIAGLIVLGVLSPLFYENIRGRYTWIILFLVVLGFTAAQFRTWDVSAPVLYKRSWKAQEVTGRIADVQPLEKAWRVVLEDLSFEKPVQKKMPARVRIKLKNNDPAEPVAGDGVKGRAVLLPLSSPVAPGAFDFQRHAYFQRLGATGYAIGDLEVITSHEKGFFFEDLRKTIRARVDVAGIADKDTAGLIKAFLIGDSRAISENDWEIARNSGIAHLIAISGSHFVMIVGVMFFFVRALLAAVPYCALHWPIKKIAALCGMAAAVFYMLLIGSPVPAQRAAVMSCVVLFAILMDRDPFTLRVAAFAAFLLLLLKPEVLVGASFQLSFAAVIGLIAFFESTKELWRRVGREENHRMKIALVTVSVFLTTLVASLATAPFALFHFMQVPLLSGLIANMVAVPLSSFITFPAGLVACLLMPMGWEKPALWLMAQSIGIIMTVAENVASWPHMIWKTGAWPVSCLVAISLGGLWVCLWQGRMRWLGIAPVVAAICVVPFVQRPDVLVSADTKLSAVRAMDDSLLISSKRTASFVRNVWTEREGRNGVAFWPKKDGEADALSCTDRFCIYKRNGHKIGFVRHTAVEPEDCAAADVVFVMKPVQQSFWRGSCTGKAVVIDKGLIYRRGAHAVYLEEGKPPRIVTSTDMRGQRPWTGR